MSLKQFYPTLTVIQALKRAGVPMPARLTRAIMTALEQGASVSQVVQQFASGHEDASRDRSPDAVTPAVRKAIKVRDNHAA